MELYSNVVSYASLLTGFEKVEEKNSAAGIDGISVDEIESNLEWHLNRLRYELVTFTYKPKPLLMFEKEKNDGSKRRLMIASVRDRIVQTAALSAMEPILEPEFENESYAYRKGFSREGAARKINLLYRKGYRWVLDADINDYFDMVNHNLLIKRLEVIIDDTNFLNLIKMWISAEYVFGSKKGKFKKGLPQGLVISPILSNLYLDKLDEHIKNNGYRLVRFADDFLILTKTKPEALKAFQLTVEILNEMQLELNTQKTAIKTFDKGFKYLGYLFLKSLILPASKEDKSNPLDIDIDTIEPELKKYIKKINNKEIQKPLQESKKQILKSSEVGLALLKALKKKGITLTEYLATLKLEKNVQEKTLIEETEEILLSEDEYKNTDLQDETSKKELTQTFPLKTTLYIQEQGAILTKEANIFIIEKNRIEMLDVPIIKIKEIIIFGTCTITPAVMQYCFRKHIPITLLSSRGNYYGIIHSASITDSNLFKLQVLRSLDKNFLLKISKNIIKYKINNSKILLQRFYKKNKINDIRTGIIELNRIITMTENAKDINQLRGFEGSAAAIYFKIYGYLFNKNTYFFTKNFSRNKRPPLDPINSLLSLGYTLLHYNIVSFLYARNLNPYVGFIHKDRANHAALASDIIEEFRNIIETLAVKVINKKILKHTDFYYAKEPGTPCFLTNAARKEYIRQFEIKMHQKITHPATGIKTDYRRCIDLQIQQLVQVLRDEKETYIPFSIKL